MAGCYVCSPGGGVGALDEVHAPHLAAGPLQAVLKVRPTSAHAPRRCDSDCACWCSRDGRDGRGRGQGGRYEMKDTKGCRNEREKE